MVGGERLHAGGIKSRNSYSIINCSAYGNTDSGIATGESCVVADCVSSGNNNGVWIGSNSTVRNCVVSKNRVDGIVCSSTCVVTNNVATGNGVTSTNGAGLYVTGTDNRIEGNSFIGADFGLQINNVGNFVVRNTATGNTTNWSIPAGNAVAPIVQATNNTTAISGNTYSGNLGSTDPNANFTY